MLQDSIERQITVRATKERVFNAIADPTQIVAWFPDAVEGTFKVGETAIFDFGKGHRSTVYVEALNPHDYFAYRWVTGYPESSNGYIGDVFARPSTLVEFRLEDTAGGTRVTVKESGFASLAPETAEATYNDHVEGWEYFVAKLNTVLGED